MVTVAEGVKRIIERSRYLQEALEKELINISSLARYIKPELEEMLIKKTSWLTKKTQKEGFNLSTRLHILTDFK